MVLRGLFLECQMSLCVLVIAKLIKFRGLTLTLENYILCYCSLHDIRHCSSLIASFTHREAKDNPSPL